MDTLKGILDVILRMARKIKAKLVNRWGSTTPSQLEESRDENRDKSNTSDKEREERMRQRRFTQRFAAISDGFY